MTTRLSSIDSVRGFVMVLMALDHVRDYFSNVHSGLLDPATTTVGLYLTRWVTHLCAPTFILLAGVSAYLMSKRMSVPELRRFLLTRGVWLIFLEMTVVIFGWTFAYDYPRGLFLQVIWAIGASMVMLGLVVHLTPATVGAIGLVMIAGHNLLDGIQPESFGSWAPLWNVLHVRGMVSFGFLSYPLIPWIGVMMFGYSFGRLYELDSQQRQPLLIKLGAGSLVTFLLLRLSNVYGDPQPWQLEGTPITTAMSFLNVQKYPPSLLYLLVMLGIAMLLLAAFEKDRPWTRRLGFLQTFGRVPLFFYVLHLYLAHLSAGLLAWYLGWQDAVLATHYRDAPAEWGFSLPWVYVAWIAVVLALYPLCRWFGEVKRRRTDWWLSYL
ncbi:MAG: heparan-alpha-glucosaminide N-acetyltransferase domain-containing protein [Steroidobacter sp.]